MINIKLLKNNAKKRRKNKRKNQKNFSAMINFNDKC